MKVRTLLLQELQRKFFKSLWMVLSQGESTLSTDQEGVISGNDGKSLFYSNPALNQKYLHSNAEKRE